MAIGSLHVDDLAKESLLRHVQRVQLEKVVAAVFENHAVQSLLLRHVDELPDFVHIHGRGHLDGHVLAVFHRLASHEEVVDPVGGDIDHVDVCALAEFLVAVFARIDFGRWHRSLLQVFLAGFGSLGFVVAESLDFDARDVGPALHGTRSAHTQSDEGHAHHVHLRRHHAEGCLLSGGHGRHFGHDRAVYYFAGPVELAGFGLLRPHCYWQHQGCEKN